MAKDNIPEVQQSAVGFRLTFQTKIPLTDTTSMKLIMKVGSDKKEITLDESNISDPNVGTVVYTTKDGDLDIVGTYTVQIIDTTPGVFLPSLKSKFKVVANIE